MEIKITDTYITLPSGKHLSLDARQTFTPDREFWSLWQSSKLDVKRSGVGVRLDEKTGEWRGYVRVNRDNGFSYTRSDLHAYWIEQAEAKAAQGNCEPVRIKSDAFLGLGPCRHGEYEVIAKRCKNGTFQLRLRCCQCGSKTQNAIAWDTLGSETVINAIAYTLQENRTVLDKLSGVDWV